MRLSEGQVAHILSVVKHHDVSATAEVYLYGSRTDDMLKGGDIDLLIVAGEIVATDLQKKKYHMLNEIKKSQLIGQRKIDLKIATHLELRTDPFLSAVAKSMVRLK